MSTRTAPPIASPPRESAPGIERRSLQQAVSGVRRTLRLRGLEAEEFLALVGSSVSTGCALDPHCSPSRADSQPRIVSSSFVLCEQHPTQRLPLVVGARPRRG